MDEFGQIVERIIVSQENIIGPIALERAQKVSGLKINWEKREFIFEGDQKKILGELVDQYRTIFGQTSVEVCKEAASGIPAERLPAILR